jgi:CRISPR-associated protein Cmr5
MTQTLDQRRAHHAWDAVSTIVQDHIREENGKRKPDETAKKYGGQARKLPARIMTSGLGQALAFLNAKGYAPELLKDISDWVLDKRVNKASTADRPEPNALVTHIIEGSSNDLRRWTDETLAYLRWLIRFADAEGLTSEED